MSLNLVSKEGKKLNVDINKIKELKTVTSFLNCDELEADIIELDEDFEIPLSDISYNTLKKIYKLCEYEYDTLNVNTTEQDKFNWYNSYFTCSNDDLFELLNGADYLNYDKLIELGTDKLANDIKSCSDIDNLKTKFGITKDLTEEEEKDIINNILFNKD
tara:strand:- start:671 stop:1150 length:480 start_codon:yes stop_codon:yes gene_type:complete